MAYDAFEGKMGTELHALKLKTISSKMNNVDHVSQNIENEINSNDVILFMKGTPVFPMCGF